jgi:branched-chain amino acid transport system permease protein
MSKTLSLRNAVVATLLIFLAVLPVYVVMTGQYFPLTLFTRIVILALAATSLNLILGYGGMVSFGHAAYLGIGGYVVGILAKEGVTSGFVQWPLAVGVSGLFALVVGALSLRTRGVYFIMITLAFAQMLYYVAVGLERYGGDDGLTIYKRSLFDVAIKISGEVWIDAGIDLSNKVAFYYLCLAMLVAAIFIIWHLVNSRFGMAIQGVRSNDRRMQAIGFPTFRYRLAAFVIAGMIGGLAGVLLANHTDFVSPAVMHWTRSGDLIIMTVLGGMGSLFGPLIGAVTLLVLEDGLSRVADFSNKIIALLPSPAASLAHSVMDYPNMIMTDYHDMIIGPLLLLVVIYARGGIEGALARIPAVSQITASSPGLSRRPRHEGAEPDDRGGRDKPGHDTAETK